MPGYPSWLCLAGGTVPLWTVCDGKTDCEDASDETQCPGRYYCNNTTLWIDPRLVCNSNKECPGGDDECQNCFGESSTASDTEMIHNTFIVILIVVECVLILVLNAIAVWDICMQEATTEPAKVNKLNLLSICFYDTLMGFYLAYIFTKSVRLTGNYCLKDYEWRSSLQCRLLGVLFTFSMHGSLFMVSISSITRCRRCVFNRNVSIKQFIGVSALMLAFNAIHSSVPVLPISAIQDIFRERMTFTDNPFILEFKASEIIRKYRVYFGENITVPSTYTMLDHLNNVSTGGDMFEAEELGYYSYSSLCIQNIYGSQESLLHYKIFYMTCLACLLLSVSASYIVIVTHSYKTSANVNQLAANEARNPRNTNLDLSVKVMLMIGSQLVCWITVMILTIVYSSLTNLHAPQLLYELTAVLIIPLNSFINPIFNSFLYKMIMGKVKQCFIKCCGKNSVAAVEATEMHQIDNQEQINVVIDASAEL